MNPNAKTPAIDDDGVKVFDSNAILLYLAEKTGKFLPPAALRGETLSWLMFIASGIGPIPASRCISPTMRRRSWPTPSSATTSRRSATGTS
ncbi:glutathione S-transferase family protein [Siccirubricoccus deserti]